MNGRDKLLSLLEDKAELMRGCRQVTEEICVRPAEELGELVARRQSFLDRAEELDLEIRALCVGDGAARAAVNHTCGRGELPEELAALYDASLAVKAAARQVLRSEETARLRLERERKHALQRLEEMNKSGSAVAGRYGQSVQTGVNRPVPGGREKKA